MSQPKVQYIEKVNDIVKNIQCLTFEKFTELYQSLNDRDTNAKPKDIQGAFRRLKEYSKSHNNSENTLTCDYHYAQDANFGRLYATNSLQGIMSAFRGPLSNGLTHDIDMENCHVSLLAFLCFQHNVECQELKCYIVKRDEYLSELQAELKINRKTAKCMFLASLNTEDLTTLYKTKRIKSQKFLNFDRETTRIIACLFDKTKHEHPERVKEGVWNHKAKYINMLLQKLENLSLQKAVKFVHDRNIAISTLMFDGMMIYADDYDVEALVEELNKEFKKSGIKWTNKPHNMELFEALSALTNYEDSDRDYYVAKDINDLAKYILGKKSLTRSQGELYFEGDRLVQSCEDEITSELYKFITSQDYYVAGDKDDISYSSNFKHTKDLISAIYLLCSTNDKYVSELWAYTKGKVFFNNCYYDLKENDIFEGNSRTPIKIDREYNGHSEKAYKTLLEKVLFPIFSMCPDGTDEENTVQMKLLQHFLYTMKQMICGNIEIKRWISLEGLRDSGKGVIVSLLEKAFGGYIRSTNSNNFIAKKAQGDESKALSWLYSCEFVRLLISQENQVGASTYDGSLFKKLCSGGDSVEVRKNYKDERQMKLQCSLMFCSNDMPRIEPSDANETKIEINMKTKFIDESFSGMKYQKYKYLPKDDTVKTDLIYQDEIIDAFIYAIFSAEKQDYPAELRKEVLESREESDEEKILSLFELSGKSCDFMSNDDIQKILIDAKAKKTLKNAKQILIGAGATNDIKTVNKRTFRGLSGICKHGESKAYAFTEASDELPAKNQKPNTMANFVQTKSMELDDE